MAKYLTVVLCLAFVAISSVNAQKGAGLERPCMRDADCIAPNSVCTIGTCACARDFVMVPYPARCLPVPKSKNDPCEDDVQCTEGFTLGSYCGESRRCDCYPLYHFKNGLCLRSGESGGCDVINVKRH